MQKEKARKLEGTVIEGYLLVSYIDSGASADVYRATRDGRVIAFKLYDLWAVDEDHGGFARLEREKESLGRIDHPNVCGFVDAGRCLIDGEERAYLVMEFVFGSSLTEYIAEHGPLPLSTFLDCASALVDGLQAIHQADLRHRDLKPDNVRLRGDDHVPVIVDFGVVGSPGKTGQDKLTESHHFMGTLHYASPEWIFRDPPEAVEDAALDVYGLGATFHEMATGQRPFGTIKNKAALMLAKRNESVVWDLPDFPPPLVLLFRRMLHISPASRPTLAECRDALLAAAPAGLAPVDRTDDVLADLQRLFSANEPAMSAGDLESERTRARLEREHALGSVVSTSLERLMEHPIRSLAGIRSVEIGDVPSTRYGNFALLPFVDVAREGDFVTRAVLLVPHRDVGVVGVAATYFLRAFAERYVLRRLLASETGRSEGNFFDVNTLAEWTGELSTVIERAVGELPEVEDAMMRLLLRVNKAKSARL